ncbi:hypothetical protein QFZ91_005674 [Paraburkholderia sp. JPY419]
MSTPSIIRIAGDDCVANRLPKTAMPSAESTISVFRSIRSANVMAIKGPNGFDAAMTNEYIRLCVTVTPLETSSVGTHDAKP